MTDRRFISLLAAVSFASMAGVDLAPARRREPPPPALPETPEERERRQRISAEAAARHSAWAAAQVEDARQRALLVERGRHLERMLALPAHDPPLTAEEILHVERSGKSPRPPKPPTREQARRLRQIERARSKDPAQFEGAALAAKLQALARIAPMTEEEARAIVRAGDPPAFRRAGGDVTCDDCGKPYRKHPLDPTVVGFDGPFLNRLCSGEIVKL